MEIGLLVAAATNAPNNRNAKPMCATAAPTSFPLPPKPCNTTRAVRNNGKDTAEG